MNCKDAIEMAAKVNRVEMSPAGARAEAIEPVIAVLPLACGRRASGLLVLARVWVLLLALLGVSGCASFGPTSVDRDRFDYIQAIAASWKQQTLLNIVKLRYADTPVFLEVAQVIGSYQLQAGVSLGGGVNFGGPPLPNTLSLGTAGTYTDRPTVVYTPLTGAHFLRVLMTPIPPPALFLLIESGWPADLLLQIGAQTVNGISNKKGGARGRAADPEFGQLLAAIQRVQASGAVGLRTEVSKETKQEATVLTLGRKDISPETLADMALVRRLLGLRPDLRELKVVYGAQAGGDDVIAIQTRSGFQIMVELGSEIQVPADHAAERRTYPSRPEPAAGPDVLLPLVRIQSGTSAPGEAYAAIKYRGYWYWIDDRDFRSKGIFTFLLVMMTLAEKDEKAPAPVVTIPAN